MLLSAGAKQAAQAKGTLSALWLRRTSSKSETPPLAQYSLDPHAKAPRNGRRRRPKPLTASIHIHFQVARSQPSLASRCHSTRIPTCGVFGRGVKVPEGNDMNCSLSSLKGGI